VQQTTREIYTKLDTLGWIFLLILSDPLKIDGVKNDSYSLKSEYGTLGDMTRAMIMCKHIL
jgi:hypothetical protein